MMNDHEAIRNFNELQTLSRHSFNAALDSATALTRGARTFASEWAEFSRRAVELGTQTTGQVLAAKSFDRAFEVQENYAKAAYEDYVGQLSRFGQICLDCAKDAYRPFEANMPEATSKLAAPSSTLADAAARAVAKPGK